MRKKPSRRIYFGILVLILCFPVWLWRDGAQEQEKVSTRGSLVKPVFILVPTSLSSVGGDVLEASKVSTVPTAAGVSPKSPTTLGVSERQAIQVASSSVPTTAAAVATSPASTFVASAGFGGGSEIVAVASGGSAPGRDFNDETCPLIEGADLPRP